MGAKLDFYKTTLRNRASKGFLGYPVATVSFYGPDDRRATKVAVAIIHHEDDDAKEITRWQIDSGDIRRDAAVFEAIFRLTQSRQVRSVAMPEEILGCPHEEGIDYPLDEVCPECPFWADRERPMDLDGPPDPPKLPNRLRSMEKTLAGLAPHDNSSSSTLDVAQDLMWDAWDTSDRKKRIAMARRALEISPDCADAYVLLAEDTSRDLEAALGLYQKGVLAGERALGPKAFEENAGHFWGILETRPYMRARNGLAECLREMGRTAEAIDHFQELLRLNPNDNQGNRDLLAACYLEAGRDSEAWDLLNRYPEGITASWAYTAALVQFRLHGASKEARKALKHAIDQNPHVREYLSGRKRMPRETPGHYSIGSVDEAVIYVDLNGAYWQKTPGAIAWLDSKDR
jgi:tetratricopeptide (TPR) repeat protein